MSLFAGYLLLDRTARKPDIASLPEALNRRGLLAVRSWEGERHGIVVASRVLGEAVSVDPGGGGMSVIAGDPVADDLHRALAAEPAETALGRARGSFCGVRIGGAGASLFTDHVGVFPLYYAVQDDVLCFSNCLRGIEAMAQLRLDIHWPAVFERIAFGQELGANTIYEQVRVLRAGEVVTLGASGLRHGLHWDWGAIERVEMPEEAASRQLLAAFREAVARRLGAERSARAFLTGGMDSRLICITLKELGVALETFNFSREGTADRVIARQFADALGSTHVEAPTDLRRILTEKVGPFAEMAAAALEARTRGRDSLQDVGDRDDRLWSGDGGSVCLGHVYMAEGMAEAVREGGAALLLRKFPSLKWDVPARLVRNGRDINRMMEENFRREIEGYALRHEGRRIYMFFLKNDQRRHLHGHVEDFDLHGIRFHLPFYDKDLLGLVMRLPLELCLRHRLYNAMMALLPEWTKAVPWQSYPGHLPSPVPIPEGIETQWSPKDKAYRRFQRRVWREKGWAALRRPIGAVIDRRVLLSYLLADMLLGRNYGYVMAAAAEVAAAQDRAFARRLRPP